MTSRVLFVSLYRRGRLIREYQFPVGVRRLLRIGRYAEADIHVRDRSAGRIHAFLEIGRSVCVLHDLGSWEPTRVNGECLRSTKVEVHPDDEISVGQTVLRLSESSQSSRQPATDLECPLGGGPAHRVLAEGLRNIGEQTAIHLQRALVQWRSRGKSADPAFATTRVPATTEPADSRTSCSGEEPQAEEYDTHRLVATLERANRGVRVVAATGLAALCLLVAGSLSALSIPTTQSAAPNPATQPALPGPATQRADNTPTLDTSTPSPEPRESRESQPRVYVVQPGDTLGSIAREELRNTNRWKELFEANRETLADPSRLEVGQRLRLPGSIR